MYSISFVSVKLRRRELAVADGISFPHSLFFVLLLLKISHFLTCHRHSTRSSSSHDLDLLRSTTAAPRTNKWKGNEKKKRKRKTITITNWLNKSGGMITIVAVYNASSFCVLRWAQGGCDDLKKWNVLCLLRVCCVVHTHTNNKLLPAKVQQHTTTVSTLIIGWSKRRARRCV